MSHINSVRRIVAAVLAVGAVFGNISPFMLAQTPLHPHPRLFERIACDCGRWTCPDCQSRLLCPPGQDAGLTPTPGTDQGTTTPQDVTQPQPIPSAADDAATSAIQRSLSSSLAFTGRDSYRGFQAPEMMGDFFGPGAGTSLIAMFDGYSNYNNETIVLPNPGYNTGRMKLSENNSPIPRNRLFFNYSLFEGVPLSNESVTVNRFSPGFETLLFDGQQSFEFRSPFAETRDSTIVDGTTVHDMEFGNLFFAFKSVLIQRHSWMLTGGISVTVPTADDTVVVDDGVEQVRIVNNSVHLMPFIGGAYVPDNRCFAQWIVQCDVDANGNSVQTLSRNSNSLSMVEAGRLTDFTFLYSDINFGYWLMRREGHSHHVVRGIAPILEMHYNRTLTEADSVTDGFSIIQNPLREYDNFNIVGGIIFDLHGTSRLAFGYATPLGNPADQFFESELRVTFNRYY